MKLLNFVTQVVDSIKEITLSMSYKRTI